VTNAGMSLFLANFRRVRKIAQSDYQPRRVFPSVRQHCEIRFPLDGFLCNLVFENFFENVSMKFKFHENLTRITGTLHEDQYKFMITSRSVLLSVRTISDKSCRKNQKTLFSKIVPFMR